MAGSSYFDPTKLAAAIAAQGKGADGRTVLTGQNLLNVLTNVNAPTYHAASTRLETHGQDDPTTETDAAYYQDSLGNKLSPVDGAQFGDPTGQYFQNSLENPSSTGGKDQAQVTYKINPDGSASPVAANNQYAPSAWSDWGRLATELGAVVGSAGLAGSALAGGGAAAGGGGGAVAGGGASLPASGGIAGASGTTGGFGSQIGAAVADAGATGGAAGGAMTPAELASFEAGGLGGAGGSSGLTSAELSSIFGPGFTPTLQQAGQAASAASTANQYMGPGSDGAGSATDAPTTDGPGGSGTAPALNNLPQSLQDAMKVGGTAVQQWIKANPALAAGLGASLAGGLTGSGSTNLNLPNFNSAAQSQQRSGMVNQTNPYGSSTYTQTGVDAQGNPIYSQNTTLNAQGQSNLNAAQGAQGTAISHLYDQSGAAAAQQAQQASYDKATAMLDPQWQQQGQALTSSLANQGIGIGSEAYNNAQTNYNNAKTTAYGQAQDSAIAAGNAEQNTLFGQNLSAAGGLGSAVQTPTFAAQPAAANYLGAAGLQGQGNINQYNATTGAQNSLNNGLFNLGGALLGNSNVTGAIGSGVGSLFGSIFGSPTPSTSGP